MQLAILHYHLNRGGVTQVILSHLAALAAWAPAEGLERVVLLYGGRHEGWSREQLAAGYGRVSVSLAETPELDYDEGAAAARPGPLARALQTALHDRGLGPDDTILHVHNHSLGKNLSLPGALCELAGRGYPLLLQIHDFAEDFRPSNYLRLTSALAPEGDPRLPAVLYPQASHVHYAVLNQRDQNVLQRAGVSPQRLHWLPNPVAEFADLPGRAAARSKLAARFEVPVAGRFVLYPVRGIRRKNLGEALLWSALAGPDATFGFTLAPLNPAEQPSYQRWRELARQLGLPCRFELGAPGGLDYRDNLAAADLLLTTSVAEGFGMAFLESCLARRPLIGRDLPEITSDFASQGVRLDRLRPRLATPLAWIGWRPFRQGLTEAYGQALAAYRRQLPAEADLERDLQQLVCDDQVDFAILEATIQQQLVHSLREQRGRRDRLLEMNPWVSQSWEREEQPALLRDNADAVRRGFSLESGGRRLWSVYRTVAASTRAGPLTPPARGGEVLDAFLHLARFHPIRTQP